MYLYVKLRFPSMFCKRVWYGRCLLFNLSVVFVKIDEIGQLFFSVVVVGIGKIRQMIVSNNCYYILIEEERRRKKSHSSRLIMKQQQNNKSFLLSLSLYIYHGWIINKYEGTEQIMLKSLFVPYY